MGHAAFLPTCLIVEKIKARACMKWALSRSNLHPSMSQNLDGAMNAACHVMHEFALKALGFMHVMHAILVGHVYACHGCLRDVCALPRVPCVQHMHACLSCMPCVLSIMHVFHNSLMAAHCIDVMHARVFICLGRDSWATRQTQHQRLAGLASTSLPRYVLVACIQKRHPCVWSMCVKDS